MRGAAKSCLRKRQHASEQDALAFAERYEGAFRAYRCKICYEWHLARKR